MNRTVSLILLSLMTVGTIQAQQLKADIAYVENAHQRQKLDVYSPNDLGERLPVLFWIHGGGWVTRDNRDVAPKPRFSTDRGFVFVPTNYRLLPDVEMVVLNRDV